MTAEQTLKPFELMDCAIITLATGKRAINLRELRENIASIEESSMNYHFFDNLLRPSFDDPEFRNDFALWAKHSLHDGKLAEKLGMINPIMFENMGEVRTNLLDVIDDHLSERAHIPFARQDQEFHFLKSKMVIFDAGRRFGSAEELGAFVPNMGTGSIFYHFIEARRRTEGKLDDFSAWLKLNGDNTLELREKLSQVDYYFSTLVEIRDRLSKLFAGFIRERSVA